MVAKSIAQRPIPGCEDHNLTVNSEEWGMCWEKMKLMMGEQEHLCPLCLIEELTQLNNNLGEKARLYIETHNSLCDAEKDFYEALDEKLKKPQERDTEAISSLDISDDKHIVRAKPRSVENGIYCGVEDEIRDMPEKAYDADDEYDAEEDNLPF